jgi:hypothetical protein
MSSALTSGASTEVAPTVVNALLIPASSCSITFVAACNCLRDSREICICWSRCRGAGFVTLIALIEWFVLR